MKLAVMLMETFDRLSRQDKYVWDVSQLSEEVSVLPIKYHGLKIIGHVRPFMSDMLDRQADRAWALSVVTLLRFH
jgi:hypothetical protein